MIENDRQFNLVDYLTCSYCKGNGRVESGRCSHCGGLGMALRFGKAFLFWRKKINKFTIAQNRLSWQIRMIIDLLLFAVGLIGLVLFAWNYKIAIDGGFTFGIWRQILFDKNILLWFFWLTIISDLYLFYRFNRQQEQKIKIKKNQSKEFGNGEPKNLNVDQWNELNRIKSRQKIEVSRAYNYQAFRAIEKAYLIAKKFHSSEIKPVHLLAGLLEDNKIRRVLWRLEIPYDLLSDKLFRVIKNQVKGKSPKMSFKARQSLIDAYKQAYKCDKTEVDTLDLLVSTVYCDQLVSDIFYDFNISLNQIENVAAWINLQQKIFKHWHRFRSLARFKPKGDLDRAMTAVATPLLDSVGYNLTTMAKLGYFPPIIGRNKEVKEIFRIMESSGLSNALLVGEQGVGKTAVVYKLAQLMVEENVPDIFKDKRLVSLDVSNLIGGMNSQQAQARLIAVLNEAIRAGNIILVIENIRELMGISLGQGGGLGIVEILNRVLRSNSVFTIATANSRDYVSHIQNEPALKSVFQKVEISEVDKNEAIQIVESRVAPIEAKNNVYFTYAAIESAVMMSVRYIHDRYLPEKALSIIEEAAVLAKKTKGDKSLVNKKDVAFVVSEIVNMPVDDTIKNESEKLLNLEEKIHRRLVGQDDAVKMASAALRRAGAELRNIKRPIVNLLFLGPTGVGKTELSKTIAEVYFGSEKNMIRLDMSEYQGDRAMERLLGSGPDGSMIGGFLTEAIREKPFSLILLDEIEKANSNILNLFLQIMEDGRLTDNSGKVADFTNAIIIATSNAGTQFIQNGIENNRTIESIRDELIDSQLQNYFKPEFLNRFDGVMVFQPLKMEEVEEIAKLMIDEVAQDLAKKGVGLLVTKEAVKELAEMGFDPALGARPLRRVIQEKIQDVLATYILENKLSRRDVVVFDSGGRVQIKKRKKL